LKVNRQHDLTHDAYCRGDLVALLKILGNPSGFPNCHQPLDLAAGDYPLEYAIYWSPMAFVAELLRLGADPSYVDPAGFPPLIAALSSRRADRNQILNLLLEHGADVGQRGINDWTPLHYAVSDRNLEAVRLLLSRGADPDLKTRIDDHTSALEDAEAIGFTEAAVLMHQSCSSKPRR